MVCTAAALRWGVLLAAMASSAGARADVLIVNGRLFTATWAGAERGDLLIRGERIEPVSAVADEEGVEIIDAAGKTVLPGLIDAHFHAFFERSGEDTHLPASDQAAAAYVENRLQAKLKEYLEQGFTTVVSPFDPWPLIIEVRERLATGELLGPRLFVAGGVFTGAGEHGVCRGRGSWCSERLIVQVSNPEGARQSVRRYVRSGVDFIAYDALHPGSADSAPATIRAIIDEAHGQGLKVLLHGVDAAQVTALVELGIDGFLNPPRVTPDTNGVLLATAGRSQLPLTITHEELVEQGVPRTNILTLLDLGAVPVFGPDLGGTEVRPREMVERTARALAASGLGNAEVLLAATRNAAQTLLGQRDLGTLAPGNRADVIIVDGDPLTDLDALGAVEVVIKGGAIVVDKR